MDSSNNEIVRRVLASVLEKLDRGRNESAAVSVSNDGSPVVLLVIGQADSGSNGAKEPTRESREPRGIEDRTSAHPGLEKFPLSEGLHTDSAPRTCFMEPGRACVNSGACEMRGY